MIIFFCHLVFKIRVLRQIEGRNYGYSGEDDPVKRRRFFTSAALPSSLKMESYSGRMIKEVDPQLKRLL